MGAYRDNIDGFRKIGQSRQMQAVCLDIAKRIAGNANAVGYSTYEYGPESVRTGWKNERRAGAVAREKTHDVRDSLDAILVRVTDSMGRRK